MSEHDPATVTRRTVTRRTVTRRAGPGRVLVAVYLVFVVAAGSRSAVQLATHAVRAPLAYALSVVAALVYLAGFLLVRRADRGAPSTALRVCSVVELLGVLVVGTASIVDQQAFPDATVWSDYGAGYAFVPLLLPVTVLAWLHRRHSAGAIIGRCTP